MTARYLPLAGAGAVSAAFARDACIAFLPALIYGAALIGLESLLRLLTRGAGR